MAVVNVEQSAAWNGGDGEHWTKYADRYDACTLAQLERLLGAGVVGRTSRVLDIGCGTGLTSRSFARIAHEGTVLGVDLSAPMLGLARQRTAAEGLTNVTFEQGDAQVHPFDVEACDVAVSFYGGMFFADPVAAYLNIAKALAPRSTLALVGWRDLPRNEWIANFRAAVAVGRDLPVPPPHAPSPFFFADADHTRDVLEAAGFGDVAFTSVDVPMPFGDTLDEAFGFVSTLGFVQWVTRDLSDSDRQRAFDALRADVAAHDTGNGVRYDSSSWLIPARRM